MADAARLAKDGLATKDGSATGVEDGSATGVEDGAATSVKDGAATASRHGAIAMRSRSLSIIRHVRWLSPAGCTLCPSAGALGLGFPLGLGLGATAAAAAPEAPATAPAAAVAASEPGASAPVAPTPPPEELLRRWKILATSVLRRSRLGSARSLSPLARSAPRSNAERGLAARREGEELAASSESSSESAGACAC